MMTGGEPNDPMLVELYAERAAVANENVRGVTTQT